jgi:serpin B
LPDFSSDLPNPIQFGFIPSMNTTRLFRLSTSLLISFGIGLAASVQASDTKSLVEGNTAFALDLYARLSGAPGNLFFSPYSISTCLAMTYAGARGDTETQMGRVLHFSKGEARLHSSFGELQQQLNDAANQKGIQLDIANALWAQKGHHFLPAFMKIAKNDYQANVNQADFKTSDASADAVRREINRWVAQKTRDKIHDILSPGSLDDLTRLVLANAIYFKGIWASPFKTRATSTQPFHLSMFRKIDVRLMRQTDDFKYTENKDFQAVELSYSGDELSMVVLLPRQFDALGQLENQLSPPFLARLLAQMKRQEVEIFLPRFKLESSFELNDMLAKMGMPDAFVWPKADFSGINGNRHDLYISGVFHKAWVEVNEEGTEAAAVTGGGMMAASLEERPPPPPVFRADHPFVFLIRDTRSGSLLFAGRLADPSK